MNIIETQNPRRRFGRMEAVHELNLSVPQGSVLALPGPNGAGKTTTLKLLMNLLPPTAGSARSGVSSKRATAARRRSVRGASASLGARASRPQFGAATVTAQRMALREIFMTLARPGRAGAMEASA